MSCRARELYGEFPTYCEAGWWEYLAAWGVGKNEVDRRISGSQNHLLSLGTPALETLGTDSLVLRSAARMRLSVWNSILETGEVLGLRIEGNGSSDSCSACRV